MIVYLHAYTHTYIYTLMYIHTYTQKKKRKRNSSYDTTYIWFICVEFKDLITIFCTSKYFAIQSVFPGPEAASPENVGEM